MFDVVFINSTADFQKLLHNVSSLVGSNESLAFERFSYDLERKTREQNRNNKGTEIERLIGLSNGNSKNPQIRTYIFRS